MSDRERFERAIDLLLADRSPRAELAALSGEEQSMVRIAQFLRGSRRQAMAPDFAERLHACLFPQRQRISRRAACLSSVGALAAGILAGVGLDRARAPAGVEEMPSLVGANGRWYPVVALAELPDGTILPFTAGAIHGFLIHRHGQLWALSRICTHMGCALQINPVEQTFGCPCHGAEFDLGGHLLLRPEPCDQPLPPLPPLLTRVNGEMVEVFGV